MLNKSSHLQTNMDNDLQTKIYTLENQIQNLVFNDNKCSVHFDYTYSDKLKHLTLSVHTFNPVHKTTFLLYSTSIYTDGKKDQLDKFKVKLLEEVSNYLKANIEPKQNMSYTVHWRKNSSEHTSYFSGKTFPEIVDKFFIGKNHHDYVIIKMVLNPQN